MREKIFLLFLMICLFSMFLVSRKNYLNELHSDLNEMIIKIQDLREIRNNLLFEKWKYLDLSNIENIARNELGLIEINGRDFFVLKKDVL